jgi:hypothetical protein
MSTSNQQGISYLPPEGGETLWVLGDQVTFKADGERDGLTLFVSTIPPGGGPPASACPLQAGRSPLRSGGDLLLPQWERVDRGAGRLVHLDSPRRATYLPQYGTRDGAALLDQYVAWGA